MKEKKKTRLQFYYLGKAYSIQVDSTHFAESLIVNKLTIGHANYWLIFQNSSWRFIGEMPLCRDIKNILAKKIAAWLGLPAINEGDLLKSQESARTGIFLNALLCVMALKKQLPL